jgi:diguanylate cyclase (GGDEF)-like protein/PAS domain S-box-containing protein
MLSQFGVKPRYIEADDFKDVFRLVQNNNADAGVVGRFFGMVNDEKYKVVATPIVFNPIEVRYGFRKVVSSGLIEAVDRNLSVMKADSNSPYHRALAKYLEVTRHSAVPQWIKWLVPVTVGLFLLFVVLNYILRREVRRRTEELDREFEERRKAESALADSEKNYRELVESANSFIIKVDTRGLITFFNEYSEKFFGFTKHEVIGKGLVGTILPETESSGRDLAGLLDAMLSHPEHHLSGENENVRKDGSRCWISWSNRPLFDDNGQLVGMLSVGQDVTERRAYENQLVYQANYDILTGLPNRNLLKDRLEHDISLFSRNTGFLGVLSLDIDNFNIINDTLGHAAGDQLLIDFSSRLQDVIRKSDTLARLSGDEFVILPGEIPNSEDAAVLAEKILSSITAPFRIADRELFISVSIGIASYPSDGDTVELLLQHAETAMFEAKRGGKNDFRFFTGDLNNRIHNRLSLETSLHRALENDEFILHYQPQVDVASGAITGMEALLRWEKSDGTIVPPMEFIPSLEDSGLIVSVGEWVLETACRKGLEMSKAAGRPLILSVNISARQFQRADIVEQLAGILEETGFPAELLRLELTESLLMGDTEATLEKLHLLKDLGVSLSIDDFGTGYSSLSYLRRLPISELKIDRAFVMNIPENKSDAVIVNTIITMAQCLGLHVVAEGVETEEQRSFLKNQRCRTFQGFLFSRPIPAAQLTELLRKNHTAS